jgi:hypothetical protein
MLAYLVEVTNNDPSSFGASAFSLEYATLPSGWAASFSEASVLVDAGATNTSVTLTVTSPSDAKEGNTTISVAATNDVDQTIRGIGSGIYEVVDRPFEITLSMDSEEAAVGARIRINDVEYGNNDVVTLSAGVHRCEAVTPVNWGWLSWSAIANITVTNPSKASTTFTVTSDGVLGAEWGPMVTFHCLPSTAGNISILWEDAVTESFSNGDQSIFRGPSSITAHSNDGYLFDGWSSTGSINLASPTSTLTMWNVTGPGILTATFLELASQLIVTLQPSSAALHGMASVVNLNYPANLSLYDSLGRYIGYNATRREVETAIPNGSYLVRGDTQRIVILNPADAYEIHVIGTSIGAYTLTVQYVDEHGTVDDMQTVEGTITADEHHAYSLRLHGQHLVVTPSSSPPPLPPPSPPPIRITLNMVLVVFAFMGVVLIMITKMEQAS